MLLPLAYLLLQNGVVNSAGSWQLLGFLLLSYVCSLNERATSHLLPPVARLTLTLPMLPQTLSDCAERLQSVAGFSGKASALVALEQTGMPLPTTLQASCAPSIQLLFIVPGRD